MKLLSIECNQRQAKLCRSCCINRISTTQGMVCRQLSGQASQWCIHRDQPQTWQFLEHSHGSVG